MGSEFYNKGANVQLGPALNVHRIPIIGRGFEYVSGEDPHLGYIMSKPIVEGIQSNKVMATAKHWIDNSQEIYRTVINEAVDERTNHELYYPPFEGAVEGGVGSVMCSYNLINGVYGCSNKDTMNDLRETLGFDGFVMSDWGATHAVSDLAAGLDHAEADEPTFWTQDSLKDVDIALVDQSVTRILKAMIRLDILDDVNTNTIDNIVTNQ